MNSVFISFVILVFECKYEFNTILTTSRNLCSMCLKAIFATLNESPEPVCPHRYAKQVKPHISVSFTPIK